jgi:hypothetical protein
MTGDSKKTAVRHRGSSVRHSPSVLRQFHCESAGYEFTLPVEAFDVQKFFRETGIKKNQPWSATVFPRDRESGFHVHFKGSIGTEEIGLTVEYWDKGKPFHGDGEDSEPFAETMMAWLGQFVRETAFRAFVWARFRKPKQTWKSRFNLPFKVTMAEQEVVIDGVSLTAPRNAQHATGAYIAVNEDSFSVSVHFVRRVEFSKFSLSDDVTSFNEAVKMFMEQAI